MPNFSPVKRIGNGSVTFDFEYPQAVVYGSREIGPRATIASPVDDGIGGKNPVLNQQSLGGGDSLRLDRHIPQDLGGPRIECGQLFKNRVGTQKRLRASIQHRRSEGE